jgi:DNA-binding SARP family transcriptional activator
MGFAILGPLAVVAQGRDFTPTAPKVRQVLAFLLLRRNQVVRVSELVDELWNSHPPDSAMTTLQTYVYKLRKDVLDPCALARLYTKPCGYLLDLADENIDLSVFEQLSLQGRLALESGDPARAAELLSEALSVWRGEALVGVSAGEVLSAYVTRLEENRLQALEMRIEADMRLGRHPELVSELKVLVFTHPLHERFHAHLMTALGRSGRRCEALDVYRRLRAMLIEELGLEPSAPLQRLHQSLLSADSGDPGGDSSTQPVAVGYAAATAAGYMSGLTVPAQLPPDVPDFTGRAACLSQVRRELAGHGDGATTARTVPICGTPGVGKTTLALHAAHVDRAQYPDGQLFANLRGTSPTPADPADVLADFLQAVGLPRYQIPAMLEERAKLFRTWCNGRQVLVVLDDAYSMSQIAPLLPATPKCAVIITSRWRLYALPGCQTVEVDVMDLAEGVELLSRIIGASKVAAAQEQVEHIVDLCGYLPLALRSVGARLAAMPSWQPRKMVGLLESGTASLDQLRFADLDVRAGYDRSYDRLDPSDRSAFRLLGLLPPKDFSVATVANLLGGTAEAVEAQLTRLVGCHLLEAEEVNDAEEARYRLHKLIRLYAQERLNRELIQPEASGRREGTYSPLA